MCGHLKPIPRYQRRHDKQRHICATRILVGGAHMLRFGMCAVGGKRQTWQKRHLCTTRRVGPIQVIQMMRSLPPSTGIWAPVVREKTDPQSSEASSATSLLVTSILSTFFVLYCSTVIP